MKNTPLWCIFYLNSSGIIGLKQATKLLGSKFVYENERQRSSNKYKFAHSRHKCAERANSISRNQSFKPFVSGRFFVGIVISTKSSKVKNKKVAIFRHFRTIFLIFYSTNNTFIIVLNRSFNSFLPSRLNF